jgi:hypothetical protein
MQLQAHILLLVIGVFASNLANAECNTVMGGCTKEDTVNVSPHMKSDYAAKNKVVKPVVAPVAANKANSKGKSNINYASATQKNTQ